jgi:fluoride exporter
MEVAFCHSDRKPPELMTPSKHEGVFFMFSYILVMLGGALGTGARFWMSGFIAERGGEFFPLGTLVVNVTGSFVIGFFAAFTGPETPVLVSPRFREFFMIGVCGGYTTFSSFSLQTLDFARDGDWLKALLNTLLSFACCLAAVWLGRILALTLLPK